MTNPQSLFHECHYYPKRLVPRLFCWSILCLVIAGLVIVRYAYILDFWWSHDDAHHLRFALEHQPLEYLFNPRIYRKFHDLYLAPWNILSYNINLYFFGPTPRLFFTHHVFSMCLLSGSTFVFLRLWTTTAWALLGVLLFSISPSATIVVSQLMNTHYLEGTFFMTLAATCFVVAVRNDMLRFAILGSGFYFLATASKEIYVPLSITLIFLPVREFKFRFRHLLPYFIVLIFYMVWRNIYIQDSFTSWMYLVNPADIVLLPWRLVTFLFSSNFIGTSLSIGTFVLFLTSLRKHPRIRVFITITTVCLLIPLLPVSFEEQASRFHILVTWSLCCTIILSLGNLKPESLTSKFLVVLLAIGFSASAVHQSQSVIAKTTKENNHFKVVGKFVLSQNANLSLYIPNHSLSVQDIKTLRQALQLGKSPTVYYDPLQFKTLPVHRESMFIYDVDTVTARSMAESYDLILNKWNNRIAEKKLMLNLTQTQSGVKWAFGPYEDNGYSVILLSQNFAFNRIRKSGTYRANLNPMIFVLRYTSDEGWITYSDILYWNRKPDEVINWSRD